MYELLIRLYYELDYKKYNIEDLKEIKNILNQFNGRTEEVKLKRVKEKSVKENKTNGSNQFDVHSSRNYTANIDNC